MTSDDQRHFIPIKNAKDMRYISKSTHLYEKNVTHIKRLKMFHSSYIKYFIKNSVRPNAWIFAVFDTPFVASVEDFNRYKLNIFLLNWWNP